MREAVTTGQWMNKRKVGSQQEEIAEQFLREQGVTILCRNFRCRQGEIDLIGREGKYLVFIEVKFRSSERYGSPGEAVGYAKQKTICLAADYYRYRNRMGADTPVRYDVIAITGSRVVWYRNAFDHRGRR